MNAPAFRWKLCSAFLPLTFIGALIPSFASSNNNLQPVTSPLYNTSSDCCEAGAGNNFLLREGDILVGEVGENILNDPQGLINSSTYKRWNNGLIPYALDNKLSQYSIGVIESAVSHWNANSSITLVPLTDRYPTDYLFFETASGCASWQGKVGGRQSILVGPTCTAGNVIHEIGHAVGLPHEHTRDDRDNFININWDNIKADKKKYFKISHNGSSIRENYDYESVMHYGPRYFSSNGLDTIQVPDGISIGQRSRLSRGDIQLVDMLYSTNLAVSAGFSADINNRGVLTVTVSNLGDRGAHLIELHFPGINNSSLTSTDQISWQCQATEEQFSCYLPVLDGKASVAFDLLLNDITAGELTGIELKSKTADTDPTDNIVLLTSEELPDDRKSLAMEEPLPFLANALNTVPGSSIESFDATGDNRLSSIGTMGLILELITLLAIRAFRLESVQRMKNFMA
ncbi:MAG: M12 family metallopeptidase [Granulosicoccus sp.]|nr:M12 family metallopeptidase [Granulosicoccus sp.]